MSEDFVIERKILKKYIGKSKEPVIPYGVKKIARSAFENAKIHTVTIPETVTEIAEEAFLCSDIREIEIPKSVTKIGKGAFSVCEKLRKVTILGKIGEGEGRIPWIFCVCPELKEVNLPDDMPRASGILSGAGKIKRVELLPTETEVMPLAFNGCWGLKEVTIPKGVTKIGFGAFGGCRSLRKIVLPEGVTEIAEKAFSGCSNLKTVVIPKSVKSIGIDSFEGCCNLGARTAAKINKIAEAAASEEDR